MKTYKVIKRPIMTEKSMGLAGEGRYCFEVAREASKNDIKRAIEAGFGVSVVGVSTSSMNPKKVRVRRQGLRRAVWGKRSFGKKAIVTVKEGDKIDLFEKK